MKKIFKTGIVLLLLLLSLTASSVLREVVGDIPYNNGVPDATGTIRYQ